MPTVTAVIDSTHFGGSTALAPPKFENADKQIIQASRVQNQLYEWWKEHWSYARHLCKRYKARLVFIHLGDGTDGDHHDTTQILPNIADQKAMACEVLEPITLWADRSYFVKGTDAHDGPAGQYMSEIAHTLHAEADWEWHLDIDGIQVLAAHHGRVGGRDWTSAAAGVAVQAKLFCLDDGWPIPRYVFMGHCHTFDDSSEKVVGTRAVMVPSWQLKTAHGHKGSALKRCDIGGLFMLPDGSLDLSHIRYIAPAGERRSIRV